jgi:hypothetical protein
MTAEHFPTTAGRNAAERAPVPPRPEPGNRPEPEPGNAPSPTEADKPPPRREGTVSDPDFSRPGAPPRPPQQDRGSQR